MQGINKSFPGVVANKSINFSVDLGEIHALVGENGAGKTTLMRILYGMYAPDAGRILLEGNEVDIPNPQAAIRLGIGMVHQEFQLVPSLTVAENITLGYEPKRGIWIDQKAMRARTRELSSQFGLQIDPSIPVSDLSVGEQQRVEILKLIYRNAKLLILDEPTAVLTPQETDNLFEVLKHLSDEGHTTIFITHKLKEVMAACQNATVLRHGSVAGEVEVAKSSEAEIARMMVGHPLEQASFKRRGEIGPPAFAVRKLRTLSDLGLPALKAVSFSIRKGEIVGLAGVEGNGQSELVESLAGLRPNEGQITIADRDISRASPRQRRDAGLAIIPENRQKQGLNSLASISDNLIANRYYHSPFSHRNIMDHLAIHQFSRHIIDRFNIIADGPTALVSTLSGGNAQKVVVARELAELPIALLAAHPTRGLDIDAARFVREEIIRLREQGTAVLLISADLDELLALSDRILVLFEGQIVGELSPTDASFERLGLLMAGKTESPPALSSMVT
jgi:simple sugar transport system ATP-binding protein